MAQIIDTLNPEQAAAVAHRGGPLLVLAGAGTGKTLTLAARVAQCVLDGADPSRLLLLTFSRRAAHTLAQRAGRLLHQALGLRASQAPPLLPWAGTFHSVAARLLREQSQLLGLAENFTIVDRADAEALMAQARERLDLGGETSGRRRFPLAATCLAIASRCLNTQQPLARVLADDHPWCAEHHDSLRRLFAAYADDKRAQAVLDYDDLLLAWHGLLGEPALAAHQGERFQQVLVDEYQDTNRLQAAILARLKPDGQGLTVVGDDAQSIYAFRGAEVDNILGFAHRFAPPARVVTLERNYRSTQPILDVANAVMDAVPEGSRHAKSLRAERHGAAAGPRPQLLTVADELDQARQVADRVLALREQGLRLRDQAVLFRTASHSAALELELARRAIPFVKFGGLRFIEASHVKDCLAVLRWAHNPRCRLAGWRVATQLPGIGPAAARRLLDAMDAADDPRAALAAWTPPPAARGDWPALLALLGSLAAAGSPWPAELGAVRDWLAPHLHRRHPDDAALRLADLDQLQRLAAAQTSRERFLTELTLDPPEASSDEAGPPHLDEDYLILSTLHSAKGQEWRAVSLLNVVDGCLPADVSAGSAAQLAEERRLLYVGITRAREHLQLLAPLRFHITQQHRHGDRHLYGGVSRFITPAVLATLDRVGPAGPQPAAAAGLSTSLAPDAQRSNAETTNAELPTTRIDLAALLGAAWR